jgi:hypothetical protein
LPGNETFQVLFRRIRPDALQTTARGSAADGVGVVPDPLERQPPSMGRDQLMDRFRSPISGGIKPDRRRRLKQRHRHLLKPLDALGGREQRVLTSSMSHAAEAKYDEMERLVRKLLDLRQLTSRSTVAASTSTD